MIRIVEKSPVYEGTWAMPKYDEALRKGKYFMDKINAFAKEIYSNFGDDNLFNGIDTIRDSIAELTIISYGKQALLFKLKREQDLTKSEAIAFIKKSLMPEFRKILGRNCLSDDNAVDAILRSTECFR